MEAVSFFFGDLNCLTSKLSSDIQTVQRLSSSPPNPTTRFEVADALAPLTNRLSGVESSVKALKADMTACPDAATGFQVASELCAVQMELANALEATLMEYGYKPDPRHRRQAWTSHDNTENTVPCSVGVPSTNPPSSSSSSQSCQLTVDDESVEVVETQDKDGEGEDELDDIDSCVDNHNQDSALVLEDGLVIPSGAAAATPRQQPTSGASVCAANTSDTLQVSEYDTPERTVVATAVEKDCDATPTLEDFGISADTRLMLNAYKTASPLPSEPLPVTATPLTGRSAGRGHAAVADNSSELSFECSPDTPAIASVPVTPATARGQTQLDDLPQSPALPRTLMSEFSEPTPYGSKKSHRRT